jgi:hypothetical protein
MTPVRFDFLAQKLFVLALLLSLGAAVDGSKRALASAY